MKDRLKLKIDMNLTALKKILIVLLLLNVIAYTTLNAQRSEYLATFSGGVVYLPTINANNVIVRYHNVLGGFKEVTFYAHRDTLSVLQLDTCKREYIALAGAYDALERRYIDSTYSTKVRNEQMVADNALERRFIDSTYFAKVRSEQMVADNAKQLRKVKRKHWLNGFLWGVPVGIIGGISMFVR